MSQEEVQNLINLIDNGTLDQIEKYVILKRMKEKDEKKPIVAKTLGVTLKTLYNKLNDYELNPNKIPDFN